MTYNQLSNFFIYFICGVIISILFDIFRSLRRSIKTSKSVTYIEDILFWIITGSFLIFIIGKVNYGELRLYIPIGIIIGAIIYYLTLSKFFMKVAVYIISLIKKIVLYIIIFISKLFGKPINFFIINLRIGKEKKMSKKKK